MERCFPRDGQGPRRRCGLMKNGAQGNDVFPRMDNGQGEGGFKKMMGPRENMFLGEKMGPWRRRFFREEMGLKRRCGLGRRWAREKMCL